MKDTSMHAHLRKPPSFRHELSRRWGTLTLSLFAAVALAACGGGGGGGGGQPQQNNTPPTVAAGNDLTITLPETATLTGQATDPQGQTLTYQWTGPAGVTFASATSASTTATFAAAGTYTLTLTVSDGSLTGSDTVVVTVNAAENTAPTVDAGADQTITLPATATLAGSATDAEGDALTYAWTSEPAAGVTFADAAAAATTATFASAGTYTLTLTVNDGVESGSDTVSVVVQDAGSGGFYPAPDTDESIPDRGWTRVDPATAGMDAARLAQAATYAQTRSDGSPLAGSGMVVKDGRLVYSWGDIDQRRASQSATKSIGGIALALALDDGLLELSDLAVNRLSTLGDPPGADNRLNEITIEQLATHTAGFPKDGSFLPLQFDPGTQWSYSDGGLNWLADTLTNVFNNDLHAVLTQRVWAVLGVNNGSVTNTDDVTWRRDEEGQRPRTPDPAIEHRELASGIGINVNAMARVGLLFLREGMWSTGRVFDASFIDTARTPPAFMANLPINQPQNYPGATTNYGVLWWTNTTGLLPDVPRDAYWAWGQGDSLIVVIPSLQLVISRIGEIVPSTSAAREWGETSWNGDYAVLEGFLNPIVCAADAASSACNP